MAEVESKESFSLDDVKTLLTKYLLDETTNASIVKKAILKVLLSDWLEVSISGLPNKHRTNLYQHVAIKLTEFKQQNPEKTDLNDLRTYLLEHVKERQNELMKDSIKMVSPIQSTEIEVKKDPDDDTSLSYSEPTAGSSTQTHETTDLETILYPLPSKLNEEKPIEVLKVEVPKHADQLSTLKTQASSSVIPNDELQQNDIDKPQQKDITTVDSSNKLTDKKEETSDPNSSDQSFRKKKKSKKTRRNTLDKPKTNPSGISTQADTLSTKTHETTDLETILYPLASKLNEEKPIEVLKVEVPKHADQLSTLKTQASSSVKPNDELQQNDIDKPQQKDITTVDSSNKLTDKKEETSDPNSSDQNFRKKKKSKKTRRNTLDKPKTNPSGISTQADTLSTKTHETTDLETILYPLASKLNEEKSIEVLKVEVPKHADQLSTLKTQQDSSVIPNDELQPNDIDKPQQKDITTVDSSNKLTDKKEETSDPNSSDQSFRKKKKSKKTRRITLDKPKTNLSELVEQAKIKDTKIESQKDTVTPPMVQIPASVANNLIEQSDSLETKPKIKGQTGVKTIDFSSYLNDGKDEALKMHATPTKLATLNQLSYSLKLNVKTDKLQLIRSEPVPTEKLVGLTIDQLLYWPGVGVKLSLPEMEIVRYCNGNIRREIAHPLALLDDDDTRKNDSAVSKFYVNKMIRSLNPPEKDIQLPHTMIVTYLERLLKAIRVSNSVSVSLSKRDDLEKILNALLIDIQKIDVAYLKTSLSYFCGKYKYYRVFQPKLQEIDDENEILVLREFYNPEIVFKITRCIFEKDMKCGVQNYLKTIIDHKNLTSINEFNQVLDKGYSLLCFNCKDEQNCRFSGPMKITLLEDHLRKECTTELNCVKCFYRESMKTLVNNKWNHKCVDQTLTTLA